MFCWLLGGLFALSGALCYAELGVIYPQAGGEYAYLRERFGKLMGFLSGWISLIVGFSAPIAAASVTLASYILQIWAVPSGSVITLSIFGIPVIILSLQVTVAVFTILMLSFIHYCGVALGSKLQNVLTSFKIIVIVVFIVSAFFVGQGSMSHFSRGWNLTSLFQDKFAVSLIFVSFSYSGWNAAAYLGSEIKKPDITLPISLIFGTSFVIVIYLLLNLVYIYSLPQQTMMGVIEIGAKSASALFGKNIGKCFSALISLALLSVLSAMIMTGPRVYYAMSKDRVFFRSLGRVNPIYKTPAASVVLQGTIAIVMVITASFDKLLVYIGFTLSIFTSLTVIGLMRLRFTAPEHPGYKTLGYPVTPLVFILGNLWIIYFSIKNRPIVSFWGLLTIFTGILMFTFFHVKNRREQQT